MRLLSQELSYLYWSTKGRLRLGSFHSPLEESLFVLVTFGVGWILWCRRVSCEVNYHADDPVFFYMRPEKLWMALVPGLHMIYTYRLAKRLLHLEVEHGHPTTSPVLAGALALIPIFSVYYLQQQLNEHWQKHLEV